MLYTTLALLRKSQACEAGLRTLTASLPESQAEDKPISLSHILKSNGLNHAIWALRATTVDSRKIAARMSIEFATACLPNFETFFPEDKRPRAALQAASDFLDGKITLAQVESAASAAESAAWSVWSVWSAWSAGSAESAAESAASAASAAASARSAWSAAWSAASAQANVFLKHIKATRKVG